MTPPRSQALLVLLLAAVAGFKLWRSPHSASNLEIVPDSVEYTVGAERLTAHLGYTIVVDGVTRPPRYPPWFSAGMLAPVLALARGELGAAILPVFACGVLAVLAAFAIGSRLAGPWGGAGAAVALLANPAFTTLSSLVMTEVPSLALGLLCCVLFLRPGESLTRAQVVAAGALGGAAFAIRPESAAFLLPVAWRIVRDQRRPWAPLLLLGTPSLLVFGATAAYNAATFGSWHRTGYQYWCPVAFEQAGMAFGLRYVPQNLERLFTAPRIAVLLFGAGGAVALWIRHRDLARKALVLVALAALPGTLLHVVYFYPEARFHIVLLAFASILGGAGLGSLLALVVRDRSWVIAVALVVAAFVPPRQADPPPHRRIVAETLAAETPADAVIVSGLDQVFLEPYVLRGTSRTIVPASRHVEYASMLVAPAALIGLVLSPEDIQSPRAPALLRAGAIDPCPIVATESPGELVRRLREGRRVFIDASFLPPDAPPQRIVPPGLHVTPNPRYRWLAELHE